MARGLSVALAASLLVGAACGASDARPVAAPPTTSARAPLPDTLLELPEVRPSTRFVRLIPPAAASRGGRRAPTTKPPVSLGVGPDASTNVGGRVVASTAYCETGRMANGQRTYDGAVAMNGQPMGSRWHVLSGPYAGRTLTVADRIGHGSQFDIAMPGRCGDAIAYGRRQITVERVG